MAYLSSHDCAGDMKEQHSSNPTVTLVASTVRDKMTSFVFVNHMMLVAPAI